MCNLFNYVFIYNSILHEVYGHTSTDMNIPITILADSSDLQGSEPEMGNALDMDGLDWLDPYKKILKVIDHEYAQKQEEQLCN